MDGRGRGEEGDARQALLVHVQGIGPSARVREKGG